MGYQTQNTIKTGSPVQKTYSGRYTGINGADPTSYKLDPGCTLARTGEGVVKLTLPGPVAGFKSVVAVCNDTGEYHELSWALSVSAKTVTFTHKTCAYADIVTGPAAEDVVSEVNFIVVVEESDCVGAGV
jgi:hypothetical protein